MVNKNWLNVIGKTKRQHKHSVHLWLIQSCNHSIFKIATKSQIGIFRLNNYLHCGLLELKREQVILLYVFLKNILLPRCKKIPRAVKTLRMMLVVGRPWWVGGWLREYAYPQPPLYRNPFGWLERTNKPTNRREPDPKL